MPIIKNAATIFLYSFRNLLIGYLKKIIAKNLEFRLVGIDNYSHLFIFLIFYNYHFAVELNS